MNKEKEINLRYLQIILIIIYIGSLCVSILLLYNEINRLNSKFFFKQKPIEIINRIIQLIIFLFFLYVTYESDTPHYDIKMLAAITSIIGAIILLYTTIVEKDNNILDPEL